MIACALALVHDFPVMYFVLKSCTLFVKKVIGRNSRKLVAAKYYWRVNTFLIFIFYLPRALKMCFCLQCGYQCLLLVNENIPWNLIWTKCSNWIYECPRFWNYITDWVKITQLHTRNSTSYLKQSQHQTTTCENKWSHVNIALQTFLHHTKKE